MQCMRECVRNIKSRIIFILPIWMRALLISNTVATTTTAAARVFQNDQSIGATAGVADGWRWLRLVSNGCDGRTVMLGGWCKTIRGWRWRRTCGLLMLCANCGLWGGTLYQMHIRVGGFGLGTNFRFYSTSGLQIQCSGTCGWGKGWCVCWMDSAKNLGGFYDLK